MKKRIVTLALVVVFLMTMVGTGMGADTTVTSPDGTGNTTLVYTVTTAFTVTIPETVTLGASPVNGNLAVTITHISHNSKIKAAITKINNNDSATEFSVAHTTVTDKTIPYTVKTSTDGTTYTDYTKGAVVGELTTTGTIYFQYTRGTVPANHPAGTYNGTVTFTITNPTN